MLERSSLHGPGPGEEMAEIAQGFRNAAARGEISAEEALRLTNEAFRELGILALATQGAIPFEQGSTQIYQLTEEAKRLRGGTSYFGDLPKSNICL